MFAEEEQALNLLFAKNAFLAEKWHLVSISEMAEKGGRGAHAPLSQIFADQLTLSQGAAYAHHTNTWPHRIFRPSYLI